MNKQADFLDTTRDALSTYVGAPVRAATGSPAVLAAGVGLLGAGAGVLGWNMLVNTTRSLGRWPARKLLGMSNQEWNDTMDEAINEKSYRYILPSVAGLLAAGGVLAANYNPREEHNGLLSWHPRVKTAALKKQAAIQNYADDVFNYTGFIPEIDFNKPVNVNTLNRDMFDNNPHLKDDPYVVNFGKSILNNAAITAGVANPTLQQIDDSAASKFKNKLSWQGLADVGMNTVIANTAAQLFTGIVGSFASLTPDLREKIVDGTTLATALVSVLK